LTAFFLVVAIAITVPSVAQTSAESAALAQLVRRGVSEAPTNFARIRGRNIGGNLFACRVVNMSGSGGPQWELTCRSASHRQQVEAVAAFVKRTVSANIPKVLDHFSQDDDSIGDLTLAWQHTDSYPLAVYATVSSIWKTEHDAKGSFSVADGSYYVLHVSYRTH
jgi:hypothetical protein